MSAAGRRRLPSDPRGDVDDLPTLPPQVALHVTLSRVSAVETEAPVNLTFELSDAGGDETGYNALLSWTYPQPGDLQYGWITLVYELQYRRLSEADNWKVRSGHGGTPVRRLEVDGVVTCRAGEAVAAGAPGGAAQPPRGRLPGPGPLPLQELAAVEQVERRHADERPRQAVCRCGERGGCYGNSHRHNAKAFSSNLLARWLPPALTPHWSDLRR